MIKTVENIIGKYAIFELANTTLPVSLMTKNFGVSTD